MKSNKPKTYGYDAGLLSNSMLQAAVVCPVKYDLLYNQKVPRKDGLWFNDSWVGTVVHECIELYDNQYDKCIDHMWETLGKTFSPELVQKIRSIWAIYHEAVEDTIADKAKWGQVCKAPEMTSYWTKKYAGLSKLMDGLSTELENFIEGSVWEDRAFTYLKKMLTCLNNWPKMRIGAPRNVELIIQGTVGPADALTKMSGTVDRIELRPDGIAICDYKTGKWGYSYSELANSDQFGLYDNILSNEGENVVEWVVYDLFLCNTVIVKPNEKIRECFQRRLATNLRYKQQLEELGKVTALPTPAGAHFKAGCPCILAKTGDCPFVYMEEA
jgi:hypothetical protein